MINYEDQHYNIRKTITVSEFRRRMAHYIAMVRYGDDWVCIQRRGMEPVYLVSRTDMAFIWEQSDEMAYGPVDPKTNMRTGRGFMYWVRDALRRDKEKNKD